jgi:O-antigen ligase
MWSAARSLATLQGTAPIQSSFHPISIDPLDTRRELFRLVALLATFQTAALMVNSGTRRMAFSVALVVAAGFEAVYGVRAAALRDYAIWGWPNSLIFNRITGTFVNPNHFAHYLAITLPFAAVLAVLAWNSSSPGAPLSQRAANMVERHLVLFSVGTLSTLASFAAILLAQSRGALLALVAGSLLIAVISVALSAYEEGGRARRIRLLIMALAGMILLIGSVAFLGRERTVARFKPLPSEEANLVGRRIGFEAGIGVWKRFPTFGSGVGTFSDVVSLAQSQDVTKLYHHAHDDYVEIAATAGTLGFTIALVTIAGGLVTLIRSIFGRRAEPSSIARRAFQTAAVTSLAVALTHALFDFNFFIPANAATIAAIAGAAASIRNVRASGRAQKGRSSVRSQTGTSPA